MKLSSELTIPVAEAEGQAAAVTAVTTAGASNVVLATETGAVQVNRLRFGFAAFVSQLGGHEAPDVIFRAALHAGAIRSAVATQTPAGGAVLCTLGADGLLVTPVAYPHQTLNQRPADGTTRLAATFAGRLLVAGAEPGGVWVWEPEAREGAEAPSRQALDGDAVALRWLRGAGAILAVAERTGTLRLFRYGEGRLEPAASIETGSELVALTGWSGPDGVPHLATGEGDGSLVLWRFDVKRVRLHDSRRLPSQAPGQAVRGLAVTRGLLAALLAPQNLKLWELGGSGEVEIELERDVRDFDLLRSQTGDPALVWLDADGRATVGGVTLERPERKARLRASSDRPITAGDPDLLEFASYARNLSLLVADRRTATPLVLAIDGAWGTGKSSLGRMVDAELPHAKPADDEDVRVFSVWFNAWMHDDAEDLAPALAGVVTASVQRLRPWWRRLVSPTPPQAVTFARRHARLLAAAGALAGGGLLLVHPSWLATALESVKLESGATIFSLGGVSVTLGFVRLVALLRGRFASAIEAFLRAPDRVADSGRIVDVREELGRRIDQATRPIPDPERRSKLPGLDRVRAWTLTRPRRLLRPLQRFLRAVLGAREERRLALFVDDLDRCRPERAIEACETISQLLDQPRLVTVVMVDLEALAANAEVVFKELAQRLHPEQEGAGWGRRFLDKIFQFEFTIPAHRPAALASVLRSSVGALEIPADAAAAATLAGEGDAETQPAAESSLAGLQELPAPTGRPRERLFAGLDDLGANRLFAAPQSLGRSASETLREHFGWAVMAPLALGIVELVNRVEPLWQKVAVGVVGGVVVIAIVAALDEWGGERTASTSQPLWPSANPLDFSLLESSPAPTESPVEAAPELPPLNLRRDEIRAVLREGDHLELGRREAERWLAGASPRTAKRLGNRLLFTVSVATDRGLLWTDSPIDGQVIGKWVTVVERWPEVSQAVRRNPRRLHEIEELARGTPDAAGFAEGLRQTARGIVDVEGLFELLVADPPLGRHCEALARLAQ